MRRLAGPKCRRRRAVPLGGFRKYSVGMPEYDVEFSMYYVVFFMYYIGKSKCYVEKSEYDAGRRRCYVRKTASAPAAADGRCRRVAPPHTKFCIP